MIFYINKTRWTDKNDKQNKEDLRKRCYNNR